MSNFEVFPPKCEGLLLHTGQREDVVNQRERKKLSDRNCSNVIQLFGSQVILLNDL